jgi:hypothetical protein
VRANARVPMVIGCVALRKLHEQGTLDWVRFIKVLEMGCEIYDSNNPGYCPIHMVLPELLTAIAGASTNEEFQIKCVTKSTGRGRGAGRGAGRGGDRAAAPM